MRPVITEGSANEKRFESKGMTCNLRTANSRTRTGNHFTAGMLCSLPTCTARATVTKRTTGYFVEEV